MPDTPIIERKSFSCCAVKVANSDPEGIVEAIVSVFSNIDHAQERVMPGFFSKSLERKLPKGVWAHDWTLPIAKTLEARELMPGDPALPEALKLLGGLYIKAAFNLRTQRGREAYEDLAFGTIDEFSIGYRVTKDAYDDNTGVRDLVEGDLYEWSPVLVGCNDATQLLSAKASPHAGLPFSDHASAVRDAVTGLLTRAEEIEALRAKDGRRLGPEAREHLAAFAVGLTSALTRVSELLATGDEPVTEPKAEPEAPIQAETPPVADPTGEILASWNALEQSLSTL